ncbi:MAG: TauD/TfdA family dioxygenase [Pseudomonadota bacterium]
MSNASTSEYPDDVEIDRVELLDNGAVARVHFSTGAAHRYHAVWLRDNAIGLRDEKNGQRLITINSIPGRIAIDRIDVGDGIVAFRFQPEDRTYDLRARWLLEHAYDSGSHRRANARQHWTGDLPLANVTFDFADVVTNDGELARCLRAFQTFGMVRLCGGPVTPEAIEQLVQRFGHIRETNYGRTFDVKAQAKPTNLAFTNLALQAHTDNPYRDPVPTVQVLYCLLNASEGGDSSVVDGFSVAQRLRQEDAEGFDCLTQFDVRFEFIAAGSAWLQAERPIIELGSHGEIASVGFNNRSIAPLTTIPFDAVPTFYRAYRRFAEYVDDPGMQLTFRLQPGDAFVVDNTRVLHGRTAVSHHGERWLRGCYADKDGVRSTLALLENPSP